MEGISRSMRKGVMRCVQDVVGKKKLLFQLEYGQKKDMSSSLLQFLFLKEQVDMDDPESKLPDKEKGELLIIDGDTDVEEP